MVKYKQIEITKDELVKTVYFILMKYAVDALHMQGTSSKRDLVGGFIERWLNKLAETAVFDFLLIDRDYKAIPDYFLYNNDSEKNAPDILGIQSKSQTIPFVQYNNGVWETLKDRPRIEVKVLRKDQFILGVRETQMIDDYYVFVESDLSPDYLTMIFEDDVFHNKYLDLLKVDSKFIKSDINSSIILPVGAQKATKVGTFSLIGIYTKDQVRQFTTSCPPKASAWYVKKVVNVDRVTGQINKEKMKVDDNKFTYKYNDLIYLPLSIMGNCENCSILKKNKGSCYLELDQVVYINGMKLSPGIAKIEFTQFERSSNWSENIAIKESFSILAKDSTEDLLQVLDKIHKNSQ